MYVDLGCWCDVGNDADCRRSDLQIRRVPGAVESLGRVFSGNFDETDD